MRKLIVISHDLQIRNLVKEGVFDRIEDADTHYLAGSRVDPDPALTGKPGFLGTLPAQSDERREAHSELRGLLLWAYRRKSQTMRTKTAARVREGRSRGLRLRALPGIRRIVIARRLRQMGFHPQLHRAIEDLRPDLVIAPTFGTDDLAMDAVQSAHALGIPSLVLIPNWDNLSSKGTFPIKPDYMGVWGEQSSEHAERIHGIPKRRATPLGAPAFERYFRHVPGSTTSHFPFRYVLFAGCFVPFDERDALIRLERLIEERGIDLKIVYRPHPWRQPRRRADFIEEGEFRHVILDPQLREGYELQRGRERGEEKLKPPMPALDYYPSLLEHAEFVVSAPTTMMVEAAIFEKQVVVIAYDDGINEFSPATWIRNTHFEGIDWIEGFHVCRSPQDVDFAFLRLARGEVPPSSRPMREQIGWWLHHDEDTYAERLGKLVARIERDHAETGGTEAGSERGGPHSGSGSAIGYRENGLASRPDATPNTASEVSK